MPRISPVSGGPCWFEFNSRDADRSLTFHRALFGWDVTSNDMGEYGSYHFLHRTGGSGTVGALCGLPPGAEAQPSHWSLYFASPDVDASIVKAKELGAQLLAEPFDVPGHGRGAVLMDPTGAAFSLWQAEDPDAGDFTMFEDHSVGWIELATRDVAAAQRFYADLFGWTFGTSAIPVDGAGDYHEISIGGTRQGGMMQMTKEWGDMPSHWSLYFPVADVDAALERCKELGGSVCVPAFDAPGVGRIARYDDPTGGGAYLIRMNPH